MIENLLLKVVVSIYLSVGETLLIDQSSLIQSSHSLLHGIAFKGVQEGSEPALDSMCVR